MYERSALIKLLASPYSWQVPRLWQRMQDDFPGILLNEVGSSCCPVSYCLVNSGAGYEISKKTRARFLSLAQSKLRLCSANHRPGYWSNLPCDWPSTAWAYSEQETENGPRSCGYRTWSTRHPSGDDSPLHPLEISGMIWWLPEAPRDSKICISAQRVSDHRLTVFCHILSIGRQRVSPFSEHHSWYEYLELF